MRLTLKSRTGNRCVTNGPRNLLVTPLPRDEALSVSSCADLEEWCRSCSPLSSSPLYDWKLRQQMPKMEESCSLSLSFSEWEESFHHGLLNRREEVKGPFPDLSLPPCAVPPTGSTVRHGWEMTRFFPRHSIGLLASPLPTASVTARHGGTCSGWKEGEW